MVPGEVPILTSLPMSRPKSIFRTTVDMSDSMSYLAYVPTFSPDAMMESIPKANIAWVSEYECSSGG
jgi:hypothetical protein